MLEWHLVQSAGRTQATRYFVDPGLLRSLKLTGETTLKRIEPHRLAALVRKTCSATHNLPSVKSTNALAAKFTRSG